MDAHGNGFALLQRNDKSGKSARIRGREDLIKYRLVPTLV